MNKWECFTEERNILGQVLRHYFVHVDSRSSKLHYVYKWAKQLRMAAFAALLTYTQGTSITSRCLRALSSSIFSQPN